MSKLVFHTLHLTVDTFSGSVADSIKRATDKKELWRGLVFVPNVDVYQRGKGIFAQFVDRDEKSNIRTRLETDLKPELFRESSIVEFGVWLYRNWGEVAKLPLNPAIKAEEIKFERTRSIAA